LNYIKKTYSILSKTRNKILNVLTPISGKSFAKQSDIENLEEVLLEADIGYDLTEKILTNLKSNFDNNDLIISDRFIKVVKDNIPFLDCDLKKNIMLVGVNGTGKTTSAAKLANYFNKEKKKKVVLIGADNYRAAAIDQLEEWSKITNVGFITNRETSHPSTIVYEGIKQSLLKDTDYTLIDTAGRLHNSSSLMDELQKMYKTALKLSSELSVLIVIDANTGQNAISQIESYKNYFPINGIILTKMDGSAKGGIALSLMMKYEIPICFIGSGEKKEDIFPFNVDLYLSGLLSKGKRDD